MLISKKNVEVSDTTMLNSSIAVCYKKYLKVMAAAIKGYEVSVCLNLNKTPIQMTGPEIWA